MDRPLDDPTYRDKLEKHIKKIEESNEMEIKGQHQSQFNVWFNDKLIDFLNKELEKLPELTEEQRKQIEYNQNSVIK